MPHIPREFALPWGAWGILLLTVAVALAWSHARLLSQDEIFTLQTDSVPTLARVVEIQRRTPISLDPMLYHALAHLSMRIVGVGKFGLRLPSLLGYLLMQAAIFSFVRRWLGERAGVVAMGVPAVTATLFYATEGRPYGLLLGLYALAMLLWQTAVRRETERVAVLVALAAVVALALNTHYFGVLVLIPLGCAEIWRTVARRRLDRPLIAAIAAGAAGEVFTLPFQHAAQEFRLHYYNGGAVGLRTISQAYRALLVDYTGLALGTQRWLAASLGLAAIVWVIVIVRRLRAETPPSEEIVFVVVLAALPAAGYLMARFLTHSMEVRYVLGAILGFSVLTGVVVAPWLRWRHVYRGVMAALVAAIVVAGAVRVRKEQQRSGVLLASLVPSAALKSAIAAAPGQRLYMQDMGHFEVAAYYEPDVWVRERMTLLESRDEELRWDGHDTVSLTAEHMRAFTGFPIVSYEAWKSRPGTKVMVLFHGGWDWTDGALAPDGAIQASLGPAMGGDAVALIFGPARFGEAVARKQE